MIRGDDDGRTAGAFPAAPADGRRVLGAEIGSFRLHLAAEGKAPKTTRLYTEAVAWFAAARLLDGGKTGWEQAGRRDVQEKVAWLLGGYSDAYACNR